MKLASGKNTIILLVLLALFSVLGIQRLLEQGKYNEMQKTTLSDPLFRKDFFSEKMLINLKYYSEECIIHLKNVENEATYFPIPESSVDKYLKVDFEDSWMMDRNYNGKSRHEGTDIMALKNIRGIYPVISVCDGYVTNIGWLEKGGYRIGVTSYSGTYYYYAHLDSYADLKEGDEVMAGEILGFMGDSGYGPEGTVGKFDVHLHFGVYFYSDEKEISVNPYYLLKALEKHKLKYAYS